MRYTYDEDEEDDYDTTGFSDATSNRRSARQSGRNTPADVGPQYTASGRQVRPRQGGEYGASLLSNQVDGSDELAPDYSGDREASDSEQPVRGGARATRAGRASTNGEKKRKRVVDDDDEGSLDDASDEAPSGEEWDSQANDDEDDAMPDADDESDGLDDEEEEGEPKSLVITLKTGNKPQTGKPKEMSETEPEAAKSPPPAKAPETEESSAAAAGAPKQEPDTSIETNGAQPASTHPQPGDIDAKPSEYPTPTSTIAGVDKLSQSTGPKPQHREGAKPSEEHNNGNVAAAQA